jgi:formamidopyrimidine-DNA glycosylase
LGDKIFSPERSGGADIARFALSAVLHRRDDAVCRGCTTSLEKAKIIGKKF